MERLTKKELIELKDGQKIVACNSKDDECNGYCMYGYCKWNDRALKKLKEYENAEEQGLLIRLPFAVGDIVYWVADAIYPFEIKDVRIDKFGINARFAYRGTEENKRYWEIVNAVDVIGEKVFLTRTEAEAALAKMEGCEWQFG